MKLISYEVELRGARTIGFVMIEEDATETDIKAAILDDLNHVTWEVVPFEKK